MNNEQTAALLREAERRGLPATNCSRWPSTNGPNPGWYPSPAGRATLAGRLRPLGLDRRTHRQAVGLIQQER